MDKYLADIQHVGLVNAANFLVALASNVKGDLCDAANLTFFVAHVVVAKALAILCVCVCVCMFVHVYHILL
jgi:hypothetical protein